MNSTKHLILIVGVLIAAAAAVGALQRQGQRPDMAEMARVATPGAEHERLGKLAGEWDVILSPPASFAQPVPGSGRAAMILGGRFLDVDFELGDAGSVGTYRYTIGFDRRHEVYTIVVMDTTGTYFVAARGVEEEGVIRMSGKDDDPMMKSMGIDKKLIIQLELESEDEFSISISRVDAGKQDQPVGRSREYKFRRKKG